MDDKKIQATIDDLDTIVPRGPARVSLQQYGGGPDESRIVANREGYLRLGIEFLKAAYAPISNTKDSQSVPLEIEYLLTDDSTVNFDWCERREEIPDSPHVQTLMDRMVPAILIGFLVVVFGLVVVGLVTVIKWVAV